MQMLGKLIEISSIWTHPVVLWLYSKRGIRKFESRSSNRRMRSTESGWIHIISNWNIVCICPCWNRAKKLARFSWISYMIIVVEMYCGVIIIIVVVIIIIIESDMYICTSHDNNYHHQRTGAGSMVFTGWQMPNPNLAIMIIIKIITILIINGNLDIR